MGNKGISLITVIVTIIVIIILSAIALYSGFGTPEQARLSSFMDAIDNIRNEVRNCKSGIF